MLPRYYKLQFDKFSELIHKLFKNPFFYFIRYFRIPWILSWNFVFHTCEDKGILISFLAHRIYTRWWDRFQQSIALPTKQDLFPVEPVPLPLPGRSTPVPPPALPPNVYTWYLQVQMDNPGMNPDEAIKLSYLLNNYGVTPQLQCLPEPIRPINNQFHFLPDPVPMTSTEITEIVTNLMEAPCQFAQSPWCTKDLQCKLCGNIGHTVIVCSKFKYPETDQGPCCFCCGQFGHVTFRCPAVDRSPSPMQSPSCLAESQHSSSKTLNLDSAHSPWSTVRPSLGPSPVDPIWATSVGPKVEPTP